jgi:glycosyltransferase involved in cell wall biosynthesis
MVGKRALHQFIVGASPGDAITGYALVLRRWLQEDGFRSEIYAESIAPALANEVRTYLEYRPRSRGETVILHQSIGSDVVDHLLSLDASYVLIYHNVTPPEFLQDVDPMLADQLARGRSQLTALRDGTLLGLADSPYNESELQQLGYSPTGVMPIPLDESRYDLEPNPDLLARHQDSGPNLLFVGRVVPNKRPEDLIKLLYHCHRITPSAKLFLVGSPWVPMYASWLQDLTEELGLDDNVVFAGHVSQRDLVTYYHLADAYISMSEHEGLGLPLIESMYFDLPVFAYAAAAVPGTLGKTGILFHHKDYEALAELVHIVIGDADLKRRILAHQRERLQGYLERQVRQTWTNHLALAATLQVE